MAEHIILRPSRAFQWFCIDTPAIYYTDINKHVSVYPTYLNIGACG